MGVCNIPNIFQEKTSEIFEGFNMLLAYIDDVLVMTKHYLQDRIKSLDTFYRDSRNQE